MTLMRDNARIRRGDLPPVLSDVHGFAGDDQPCDDITLVVLKRTAADRVPGIRSGPVDLPGLRRHPVDPRARQGVGEDARRKRADPPHRSSRPRPDDFRRLTEGLLKPFPQAEDVLRQLRASRRTLYVLTSRTGERVPAAERWLDRFAWRDIFDELFFNLEAEDADRFKAKILRSTAIDVHVDDDAETLSYLSREFPERLVVHMNCYRRKSPRGGQHHRRPFVGGDPRHIVRGQRTLGTWPLVAARTHNGGANGLARAGVPIGRFAPSRLRTKKSNIFRSP